MFFKIKSHLTSKLLLISLLAISPYLAACSDSNASAPLPVISVTGPTMTEGNSNTTNFVFTVSVTPALGAGRTVSFNYRTIDGTASGACSDFIAVASETGRISQNQNETRITIRVKGDTDIEDNENFQIEISNIRGAAASGGTLTATGNITNDDMAPSGDTDNDGTLDASDVDDDGDGLIEIRRPEELTKIRYDLAGARYDTNGDGTCTGDGLTTRHDCEAPKGKWDFAANTCSVPNLTTRQDCIAPKGTWTETSSGINTGCGGQNGISSCSGYELINDITLPPPVEPAVKNWTPVAGAFNGTFDGNNKSICNVTINDGGTLVGFFSILSRTSTVKNLNFQGGSVTSTNTSGALSNNNILHPIEVGMAAGRVDIGAILDKVSSNAAVRAGAGDWDSVGGLTGNNRGTIRNSYTLGSTYGDDGLSDRVGGLVGFNSGLIQNSYAAGAVEGGGGDSDRVGGLAGSNGGIIQNSYAVGNADGGDGASDSVGGLTGILSTQGIIQNSYAVGNADGGDGDYDSVGGLAGLNLGTIQSSYAIGNVNGGAGALDSVGGIVGTNDVTINGVPISGTVQSCYYNSDAAISGGVPNMLGTPKTEDQLKSVDVARTISDFTQAAAWSTKDWNFGVSGTHYPSVLSYAVADLSTEALCTAESGTWVAGRNICEINAQGRDLSTRELCFAAIGTNGVRGSWYPSSSTCSITIAPQIQGELLCSQPGQGRDRVAQPSSGCI